MNCGRLSAPNGARNGSGWLSIAKRAKLWAWRLERAPKQLHGNYGPPYRWSIVNVRSATLIFGGHTRPYYHRNAIVRWEKRADKRIILSGSITRCASGVVGWCAKRSPFRRSWPITLARSGISSTTITHSNAPNLPSLPMHDYPRATGGSNWISWAQRVATIIGKRAKATASQPGISGLIGKFSVPLAQQERPVSAGRPRSINAPMR